ncbi:primosomal protein DnaI [Ureibacillus sp. FSL K6-8385]|uniref:primosomal protein DnaI n=1 Tax=Ureibacillus TaxID=160795 RepID=UPI0024828104|nr:primosomal protein DnaI [Ureibacillus terrenus]MED3661965.1 primosomal protein DnaI [Ureibacillus terrenus]MED3764771.1 primosomal protein DnaI [Ureibacillus terrenus]
MKKALEKFQIPSFEERYNAIRNQILEHPDVQKFLAEHDDVVNKDMVERSLPKLYEYISQSSECCNCGSTEQCTNYLKGFIPKLCIAHNSIDVEYERCKQKMIEDERREIESMISSMHMPKDVLSATLKDLYIDDTSRVEIANYAADFIAHYKNTGELPKKGFYLYGEFGVGKSFVLGAIANELATLKVASVLVFVPEFLRELKNSIHDQTLQEKIDYVKQAPVLMLDDIGAETLTSWTRDEILGPILHYRMSEQLPTFITSNFDYDGLEHHLAQNSRGDVEVVKAARIMERIKAVTVPIRMTGKNRRR